MGKDIDGNNVKCTCGMADTSFLDWRLGDLVVESSPASLKVFGAISSRGTIYLLTFTNITWAGVRFG